MSEGDKGRALSSVSVQIIVRTVSRYTSRTACVGTINGSTSPEDALVAAVTELVNVGKIAGIGPRLQDVLAKAFV